MKNSGIFFLLIIFILSADFICAEDTEKDELISITEERRETLNFGIDSEIISLLQKMTDDEDDTLSELTGEIFSHTSNSDILNACVAYFIKIKYAGASETAERIVQNWEDEDFSSLSAALRYISEFPNEKSEEIILPLVKHDNKTLASAALTAFGKCGTDKSVDFLLDLLEDDDFTEELKPTIIRALGDIGSDKSVDVLIEILEDVDEEKSWRWNACEALGKIGNPDALPVIRQTLQDKDTYLRAYAVKALVSFDDDKIEADLIDALKDSFWRVRVSASEALGERKSKDAVDILIYKAKKDPEKNVKVAAVKALGQISTRESLIFLRDLYKKSTSLQSLRTEAAEIIIRDDLDASMDTITAVLAEEWEKDSSPVLGYTCKFLSKAENPGLEPLFERMLNHSDVAIKIYGIRGIQLNGFKNQKERLESLTKENVNNAVRRAALGALESF